MNLYNELKKINRNYYDDSINLDNDFQLSRKKITNFFKYAEKEWIIDSFDNIDSLRANHSMSLDCQ